jgi:hypothetical protein
VVRYPAVDDTNFLHGTSSGRRKDVEQTGVAGWFVDVLLQVAAGEDVIKVGVDRPTVCSVAIHVATENGRRGTFRRNVGQQG